MLDTKFIFTIKQQFEKEETLLRIKAYSPLRFVVQKFINKALQF